MTNLDKRTRHVRWSFAHTRELLPSAAIRRGDGSSRLPRRSLDLDDVVIGQEGDSLSLAQVLERSHVDGFMVIHRGEVAYERYLALQPETPHLLHSVSKSLTAALAGVVVGEGRLHTTDLVTDHLPELGGTSWDGCTIEHLLDMRAGVAFDETDYEDEASESYRGFRIMGWMPRHVTDPTPAAYIEAMSLQGEHGGPFEYRSILTDVLGWCLERATDQPLTSLFSSRIWQPLGAAFDGDLILGPGGFPLTDGGFCVALEDLGRFGLMFLQGGEIDGRQVVPRDWVRRVRTADTELMDAFGQSPESRDMPPTAFYHDQWWIDDAEAGIYSGYGIHGQQVLVHHPTETVVVRLSSWPHPSDNEASRLAEAASFAVCDALS